MRKSVELDQLLENAVATALGLDQPHRSSASKPRKSRKQSARPHNRAGATRDQQRVAA